MVIKSLYSRIYPSGNVIFSLEVEIFSSGNLFGTLQNLLTKSNIWLLLYLRQ